MITQKNSQAEKSLDQILSELKTEIQAIKESDNKVQTLEESNYLKKIITPLKFINPEFTYTYFVWQIRNNLPHGAISQLSREFGIERTLVSKFFNGEFPHWIKSGKYHKLILRSFEFIREKYQRDAEVEEKIFSDELKETKRIQQYQELLQNIE